MRTTSTFARMYRERVQATGKSLVSCLSRKSWPYPNGAEISYRRALKAYLWGIVRPYIEAQLAMYQGVHGDALQIKDVAPGLPNVSTLLDFGEVVDRKNKAGWVSLQEVAIGEKFAMDTPGVSGVLKGWASTQVTLISNATTALEQSVNLRVRQGVQKGWTPAQVKSLLLSDMPDMTARRAQTVARDQVSKLNGDLTQLRMEDAGFETYTWETAQDERVRGLPGGRYPAAHPSHWVMQGLVCRWDDPTVCLDKASGEWVPRPGNAPLTHPGSDILCRCVALPNWDELKELEGRPAMVSVPSVQGAAPDRPELEAQWAKDGFSLGAGSSAMRAQLEAKHVAALAVKDLATPSPEEDIIKLLSGDDRTEGSCSSLCLAYIANKQGIQVLDFRGGSSLQVFSHLRGNGFTDLAGLASKQSAISRSTAPVWDLLSTLKGDSKEYMLGFAHHIAMVKRVGKDWMYLELQQEKGGWQKLGKTELRQRFGFRGRQWGRATVIDPESLRGSAEFRSLLPFINTASENQQRGAGGQAK